MDSGQKSLNAAGIAIAIMAVLLFISVVLLLKQQRISAYADERSSIAAAVSHIIYDVPVGSVDQGIQSSLVYSNLPVREAFARALRREAPSGAIVKTTTDGNGVGYVLFATLAMVLLGATLGSLPFFYLIVLGVSAACFTARYRGKQLYFLVLYMFATTVLLLSPIGDPTGPWVHQIPVGGIRYFSVFAILPAAHVLFEVIAATTPEYRFRLRDFGLLTVQVFLLTGAILIRSSTAYLLAAIACAALFLFFGKLRRGSPLRPLVTVTAFSLTLAIVFGSLFYVFLPREYKATGRVTGVLWHRVVVSLGTNPRWPFGDLREFYDCRPGIPEGLQPSLVDRNGHCIWLSVGFGRGMTGSELIEGVYGGSYERTMRTAFFHIAREYPRETAATFLYYKPTMLVGTLIEVVKPDFGMNAGAWLIASTLLTAALLFRVFAISALEACPGLLWGALGLFTVLAVPPQLVAWSQPSTIADISTYMFMGLGILLGEAAGAAHRRGRRRIMTLWPER